MTPLASKKCGPLPLDHHLYRFLYEQRRRFGTGAWHLFDTHDVIASSTGISTKRGKIPSAYSVLRNTMIGSVHSENSQFGRKY